MMGTYDILALVDSGCEDLAVKEIDILIGKKAVNGRNVVRVNGIDEKECATIAYRMQTARRVLLHLSDAIDEEELLRQSLSEETLRTILPVGASFKAEGDILMQDTKSHDPTRPDTPSQELIENVGGHIKKITDNKVSLGSPDVIFVVCQTPERTWLGADMVGKPLAKREYRIMPGHRSLKGTVAASLVIQSGATKKDTILDPLGDDGTIAIEAAMLFSGMSVRKFLPRFAFERFPSFAGHDWKSWKDKQNQEFGDVPKIIVYTGLLRDMKAVRMNSKLAGVEKYIKSTRVPVDWMETKAGESEIDKIITAPIPSGRSMPLTLATKLVKELFYQAEFVLKKSGIITCITEKPEELFPEAKRFGFQKTSETKVLMGKRMMHIVSFKNTKKPEE